MPGGDRNLLQMVQAVVSVKAGHWRVLAGAVAKEVLSTALALMAAALLAQNANFLLGWRIDPELAATPVHPVVLVLLFAWMAIVFLTLSGSLVTIALSGPDSLRESAKLEKFKMLMSIIKKD